MARVVSSTLFAIVVAAAGCHHGAPSRLPGTPQTARAASVVEPAPASLTASDGTGLRIASLHARAVIEGPLAFTEMTFAFENPTARTLEGTFRLTLPRGASLGRFAMRVDDRWQEAEVVELARARVVYEDFLHRKQDPALLERAAGNELSARVFPIPANGTKAIVVSYVEELKGGKYTLPLHGLPILGALDVETNVPGPAGVLHATDAAPASDFTVAVPDRSVRSGERAVLRVSPPVDTTPEEIDDAIVLVDTSASRALGFAAELDAVAAVVTKVKGRAIVTAFDQTVSVVYDGPARAFGGAHLERLETRGALGASDLERALAWAAKTAARERIARVVVVTDGVATAGAPPGVDALKAAGVERLDAVAVGGIRDDAMLARLVRGTLPRDGVVAEANELARLTRSTRSHVAVTLPGAVRWWPKTLDGVQAGDTYSIYAELGSPPRVAFDDGPAEPIETVAADGALVERAIAEAQVASLLALEPTASDATEPAIRRQILDLALRERVVTPYTAMLVLETEPDFRRFGIERRSLNDILAIDEGAVKRVHRSDVVVSRADAERSVVVTSSLATARGGADTIAFLRLDEPEQPDDHRSPYEGRLEEVMALLAARRSDDAFAAAKRWRGEAPGDVLALLALGEAAEARKDLELAERAYGSIIDLFANRADLRRFAGERLERVALTDPRALDLAIDTYRKALADRPDHPSAHRLLTFALLRRHDFEGAFENALRARRHVFGADDAGGIDRILREDVGLTAAALVADQPHLRFTVMEQLRQAGGVIENAPSLRFVLDWETDANDVELRVRDAAGANGRYVGITTGYGPACFTVRGAHSMRPYRVEARYGARGPMGYGMGKLEVIEHDGAGHLTFDERPFVVMVDRGFVDLGTVK